jgi:hypothetical protein
MKGCRSKQENVLASCYPLLPYEPGVIPYVEHHVYVPDFSLGGGKYLELKEYMRYPDVAKYEAIAAANPQIQIIFWVIRCDARTLRRLEKTFTTYTGKYIPQDIHDMAFAYENRLLRMEVDDER